MKPDVVHTLASLLFTYLMFGIKSQWYGVKSDSEHKPTFIHLQRKTNQDPVLWIIDNYKYNL